jgi:GNAT superfamily N-acetyltransferase
MQLRKIKKDNMDMIIWNPEENVVTKLRDILRIYNRPYFDGFEQQTLIINLEPGYKFDDGGAYCTIFGHVLEINYLVIQESLRHLGLGSKLMHLIENLAKEKYCQKIILNTFNFQAKDFYIKHGFHVTHHVAGYPNQTIKYYMEKDIN